MRDVVIVVDGATDARGQLLNPLPALLSMIAALKQAIAAEPESKEKPHSVQIVTVADLDLSVDGPAAIVCPLTLNLPQQLNFPGQAVFAACRDVSLLREQVQQQWHYTTGTGNFWLPIVHTAKGALFGEAIALTGTVADTVDLLTPPTHYQQPLHLSDSLRQPLYQLGHKLLRWLAAPPGVYLLQFGVQQQDIVFDALLPYPAAPAIASLGVQTPDLFACHWRCLTKKAIVDLAIASPVPYQTLSTTGELTSHG